MKFKTWLSLLTAFAIVLIIYLARHDLVVAWQLLDKVNIWILLLLIPAQLLSYYAIGAIIFTYLRAKGELQKVGAWTMARIALELNFVNHTLPSGGVSGFSYLNWRLKHIGVASSRATMAQVVRYASSFGVYLLLLLLALLVLTIDGNVNRFTILVSSVLGVTIIFMTLFVVYIIGSESRLESFASSLTKVVNRFGRQILRRKKSLLKEKRLLDYFQELHRDYRELLASPRDLQKPLLWALVFNIAEISMFLIAFAALGTFVDPAPVLIAYGVAGLAGIFVLTPGGAGAYEALMISFLVTAGVNQGTAIAGILLARVILIMGTIISGYVFYQLALWRYGKDTAHS